MTHSTDVVEYISHFVYLVLENSSYFMVDILWGSYYLPVNGK